MNQPVGRVTRAMLNPEQRKAAEVSGVKKFRLRVLPLLFVAYMIAYIDRVNIGYAKLTMSADIGLSTAAFGLGAGLFFVGYCLFEIPSNMTMTRFGARLWIARIMVTWGAVTIAMMFVSNPVQFYVLRFLLGAAEAGFAPAAIYYVACWIPPQLRGRVMAVFLMAIPTSAVVIGPASGYILNFGGPFAGWQWLFGISGLLAVLYAPVILKFLPDRPETSTFLNDHEHAVLDPLHKGQAKGSLAGKFAGFGVYLAHPAIWGMILILLVIYAATYAMAAFLPTMLKGFDGLSTVQIGWASAVPNLTAIVGTYLVARNSERAQEWRWHLAGVCTLGAVGFLLLPLAADKSLFLFLVAASGIAVFTYSYSGPFWALIIARIGPQPGALALVTTIGATGGFFGPTFLGWAMSATGGSYDGAAWVFGGLVLAGAVLTVAVCRNQHVFDAAKVQDVDTSDSAVVEGVKE